MSVTDIKFLPNMHPVLTEENDPNRIVRGPDGDPVRDPRLVSMTERESYERVIDGLKMAAEACAHLAVHEYRVKNGEGVMAYSGLGRRLDQVRLIAVELAGIGETMRQRETRDVRTEPMKYLASRRRLRDGLRQASGGMRQLAVCFRNDRRWSMLAGKIDELHEKLKGRRSNLLLPQKPKLIMPEHGTRQ